MIDDARLAPFPGVLAAIRDLAADNRSGAAEILSRAANVFELLAEAAGGGEATLVAAVGAALLKAQPDMAPVTNLVARVRAAADSTASRADALRHGSLTAREFVAWALRAAQAAAEHAASLIVGGSRVLTHSRSSTVMNAFGIARRQGRTFNLFVTESRPMMEGRSVAVEAAGLGIPVTLIADAASALVMDGIDLVIVGADKVTSRGVVNKIGTRLVALSARERCRPVYAVCDTSKFESSEHSTSSGDLGRRDPDELWTGAPEHVRVRNFYFEETPLDLLTAIVTEDGIRGRANCQFA
jgi:translation initiation factor 2B subunit (eIF-2B alpha/beta/delta family)